MANFWILFLERFLVSVIMEHVSVHDERADDEQSMNGFRAEKITSKKE